MRNLGNAAGNSSHSRHVRGSIVERNHATVQNVARPLPHSILLKIIKKSILERKHISDKNVSITLYSAHIFKPTTESTEEKNSICVQYEKSFTYLSTLINTEFILERKNTNMKNVASQMP